LWVLLHMGEGTHKLRPVGPPLEGATHKFDLDDALANTPNIKLTKALLESQLRKGWYRILSCVIWRGVSRGRTRQ